MYNAQKPASSELPSAGRLLRSTAIAITAAAALLVTVVLPAEYAVDPTGAGRLLGLTQMGKVKVALAREAEQEALAAQGSEVAPATAPVVPTSGATSSAPQPASAGKSEELTLTLAPDQAAEIKAEMRKGATVTYVWSTDGPKLNFDTHGDGAGISYHGYGKGSEVRSEGVLTAAFDGSHGWFWRNRSGKPVTVTLRVNGDFARLKRVV
jgi:hypothetical protein